MRRAQATVETLIAVIAIVTMFFAAYRYSRMLAARTLLDHAAGRAARAKAVGLNDFMCIKSARVAMIPVAGRRTNPVGIDGVDEVSIIPIYLSSYDWPMAAGTLDYEYWPSTKVGVRSGQGIAPIAEAAVRLSTEDFDITGKSSVESHYPFYMNGE